MKEFTKQDLCQFATDWMLHCKTASYEDRLLRIDDFLFVWINNKDSIKCDNRSLNQYSKTDNQCPQCGKPLIVCSECQIFYQ